MSPVRTQWEDSMGRTFRLALVGAALSVALVTSLGTLAAGASSGGNILPPVGNSKPVYGGTLKIVGNGDVDHLDTCCAYYTTTYEMLRMVSRQLVSYKTARSDPAPTTTVPDMATYT